MSINQTTYRNSATGRTQRRLRADYIIEGNLEVTGRLTQDGEAVGGSGGGTYEIPTGAINGSNAAFTFTAPPKLIFRNGVMERRLGSISGNVFTFDTAPEADDNIEGLI